MKYQTGEAMNPFLVPLVYIWSYCCFTQLVLPHLMTDLKMKQGNLTAPFPCSNVPPRGYSELRLCAHRHCHVFSSSCSHKHFIGWHIARIQTNSWHVQFFCTDFALQAKNICPVGHAHRRLLEDQRDKHTVFILMSGLHLVMAALLQGNAVHRPVTLIGDMSCASQL